MRSGHHLDVGRDEVATRQDVAHPIMALRDAVAWPDGAELHRHAAALGNPLLGL